MRKTLHTLFILLLLFGVSSTAYAQDPGQDPDPAAETPKQPRVMILGNVYGGGELAQVIAESREVAAEQLIQDADLADLFTTHTDHVYTTYVHLGTNSEVYGRVFGGGRGQHDGAILSSGRVTGQTDVALDGATVWSEIYGGGEMADVRGNTLLHFKKGYAGHNAFGGGLGKLGKRESSDPGAALIELGPEDNLPDNRYEPLASADVMMIPYFYDEIIKEDRKGNLTTSTLQRYYSNGKPITGQGYWMTEKRTGESFVVFDGKEETDGTATYTHYEFKKARTVNRDANGRPEKRSVGGELLYYTETDQFNASRPEQLFSINHNIYGGGMTASKIDNKTFVHINYGMVNDEMMDYEHEVDGENQKVWSTVYNSIANAQFCVFGGGYGYYTDILGDTNVTMDVQGSGHYKYINEFTQHFATTGKENHHWDTNTGDPEAIYAAADEATHSHGAPGRSCMDIVGGGYNGKVHGSTHVTVGGDVVLRKVYGGGYYSSVGNTNVTIKSGIFNRVYGGGLIGNVYGTANLTFGQQGGAEVHDANLHLMVKDAIYGGNDVSGTVGTSPATVHEAGGVRYNYYSPVDNGTTGYYGTGQTNYGVRLNIYGGLVLGDVYGAGNGNHPGYGNPEYMEFGFSQHPSENYRTLPHAVPVKGVSKDKVYKYRPRTARVEMNIVGNAGKDFNDDPQVDKVRIWGRTFGGGNSCNVGVWDGTADDNAEVYADDASSWHPGDNFEGGGSIYINIGSHVQLGNRNDNHETPNGLFMGSNGEHMITQHTDKEKAKYYHQYYDSKAERYYPGFVVYEDDANTPIKRTTGLKAFKAFINNILTKSDNVRLNVSSDATDVWMSNFVGGGYRGSMQAATATGKFDYTLPEGVTIGHAVVGGAFNAHIIYRVYATNYGNGTYKTDDDGNYIYETVEPNQGVLSKAEAEAAGKTDYDYIKKLYAEGHEGEEAYKTGYLRYNFDGGILAHDSQMNSSSTGSRIHAVKNASTASDFITPTQGYNANKNKALLSLDLRNRLDPVINNKGEDNENVHGGIVYGGCFNSGFIEGDVWVDYRCSLTNNAEDVTTDGKGKYYDKTNIDTYTHADNMTTYRALLVFGAGYGEDTTVDGDVYLRLLHNGTSANTRDYPLIYNAFGGGNMGKVSGNTNVYYNVGNRGTLLGSVYGGGYQGEIGGNTYLEMAGGLAINAYGGSREANIGGAAHVWVYDGKKFPAGEDTDEDKRDLAPLLIGNLYGGNDISGTISGGATASYAGSQWDAIAGTSFNTYVQVASTKAEGSRGFPLIGNLFAGGNGVNNNDPAKAPNVEKSLLHIVGGNILRAFGGGNRATVTEDACILVNAQNDVFTSQEFESIQKEIIQISVFKDIYAGYHWGGADGNTLNIDHYHAVNLFGGNNLAEMRIQPKWNLLDGSLGNVYSGGNMGDMTYYNPAGGTTGHETEPKGLSITVNSDNIHIHSLFGGCRMSDVKATLYDKDGEGNETATPQNLVETEYGATVNVMKGRIENVYGGNDVSGYVYGGSTVNLTGSVTGSVYAGGNGNYLYACDKTAGHELVGDNDIVEKWNDKLQKVVYYIPGKASDTPLQQLLAINNARPNVEKSNLYIAGASASDKVYISNAVYCGGNAATVRPILNADATVKFNIGDNAIVNAVFMGSNGESLKYNENDASNTYIEDFEKVNGFNLATDLTESDWNVLKDDNTSTADKELLTTSPNPETIKVLGTDLRAQLYPNLLSVYMRAVDVKALPQGFTEFSNHEFHNTWLGTFCMGGNAGSMMMDQPVDIVFPQSINLFGRIIGGCRDASFQYKGRWHRGGFRMPLASDAKLDGQPTKTKLRMKIRGDWYSRRMVVDEADTYKNEVDGVAPIGDYLVIDKTDNGVDWKADGAAWHDGCNVYGGCYESGDMVGDVQIYIESDMLAYSRYIDTPNIDDYQNAELDESNRLHIPVANVYGAGYGAESRNFGDAYIYMKDIPGNTGTVHPSVNNIFGGGRNGMLVGNSVIHVHDGLVFKDVVGGCFAAPLYGSSQVTVGYPKFYICKQSGEYFLDRADKWNEGHMTKGNNRQDDVIKKSIKYFEGTYVPCNVYDQITGVKVYTNDTAGELTDIKEHLQTYKESESDSNVYFEYHDEGADDSIFPEGGWNNVEIRVRGGVYGGGFSLNNSTAAVAGSYTTLASTEKYNHGTDSKGNSSEGYGGNSSVIISDFVGTPAVGQEVKDHIKISTSKSGGVFGDGRLVFCEGFRAAELNGYGYAEAAGTSSPLELNTIQRLDLLTLNDCCMQLDGDQDFATDQLDSRPYSMARIGELRMNSSIDANSNFGTQRNYIGFNNNVHFLGAIVTNDGFDSATFHSNEGHTGFGTYSIEKKGFIDVYTANHTDPSYDQKTFKSRNVGTARNMIGLNSGYYLRIENQYYEDGKKQSYYGPIVGVCEVKLNNVQPGEGGGYIYADNIHEACEDALGTEHEKDTYFLNTSGNFVFPGYDTGETDGEGSAIMQYLVDDCFMKHFGTPEALTTQNGSLDEAHYWYVEGDTYYYNTTLTALSYNSTKTFDLTTNDPNVIFSGIENGSNVTLESVQWQTPTPAYPYGYTSDIRGGRDAELVALSGSDKKYEFTLQVGNGSTWSQVMPRSIANATETIDQANKPSGIYTITDGQPATPQFNVQLFSNVNNNPKGQEEAYYNAHLAQPEKVKLTFKSKKAGQTDKTYIVTLDINYVQGPSFTGNVQLHNCALPGERIEFSSDGIEVKTTDLLPITGFDWKLVPLTREELNGSTHKMEYEWNANDARAMVIPSTDYAVNLAGGVSGSVPALYSQNHWNVFYTFTAGGETFTVEPTKEETADLHKRMLVVHNYHRMKDLKAENFNTSLTSTTGSIYAKVLADNARIYIEDEADLAEFLTALAGHVDVLGHDDVPAYDFSGQHVILTTDLTGVDHNAFASFKGSFDALGHSITLATQGTNDNAASIAALFGISTEPGAVNPSVHNLLVLDGSTDESSDDYRYGKQTYDLNTYYLAKRQAVLTNSDARTEAEKYVEDYYANGDYQYAGIQNKETNAYLRLGAPFYGEPKTNHDTDHTHDVRRWDEASGKNVPLYEVDYATTTFATPVAGDYNDYIYFGQNIAKSNDSNDGYSSNEVRPYPVAHNVNVSNVHNVSGDVSNRVFRAEGYYRSSTKQGFFHNADAVVLNPTTTAVRFDPTETMTMDQPNAGITMFDVDSNKDYENDDDDDALHYDNATFGHVTQNLLVYNDGEDVFAYRDTKDCQEAEVRYHNVEKRHLPDPSGVHNGDDALDYSPHRVPDASIYTGIPTRVNPADYFTDYFHLVDKQEFCAPIAFDVDVLAWYERLPQSYRSVWGSAASDYDVPSAWEGICLPFTVVTVNGEAPGNIISHFYGDDIDMDGVYNGSDSHSYSPPRKADASINTSLVEWSKTNDHTLHHEYWLTGLVRADGEKATFARPGLSAGGDLYYHARQHHDDYLFENTYYRTLPHYLDHYGTRDDDVYGGGNDQPWYSVPHTFKGYIHQTHDLPYLIAFPGDGYYEFDLSESGPIDHNQVITFSAPVTTIPVSAPVTTDVGTHHHVGTYLHVAADVGRYVTNDDGTAFVPDQAVLPFRTYMTTASPSVRRIVIRGYYDNDNDDDNDDVSIGDSAEPTLIIYGEGTTIVVESNYDTQLPVYTPEGRRMRVLSVTSGTNRYENFLPNVYIVGGKKLRLQ